MSKLYIPVMNSNITVENINEYLDIFREMNADTIFISYDRENLFSFDRKESLKELNEKIRFFESNGLEVGVWVQAFGFANILDEEARKKTENFVRIRSVTGNEHIGGFDEFCPLDENFLKLYCSFIRDIASVNPSMIMLDDDLCLSVRPGIGCFCQNHLKVYEEKIGEKVEIKSLKNLIFTNSKNRYRSAWLEMMHDTLCDFCKEVRNAVDSVNDKIRVGICASYTSWDIEGASTAELSKILAGKTKPFFRFAGAPYWVSRDINRFPGQRLNSVIECARMQIKWCEGEDIEMFSESDSYPRPRYHVPASYIEAFSLDVSTYENIGSLKYVCDYFSSPAYERGYVELHRKNKPVYDFIKKYFHNKKFCGVSVIEKMNKIENTVLPGFFIGEENIMSSRFFSSAAAMLTSLSIPVTYDEGDCVAAFGDNAACLDKLPKKLITDYPGAMALMKKGFDVGIKSSKRCGTPGTEHYPNDRVLLFGLRSLYYECELKENANVQTVFEDMNKKKFPASYTCSSDGCEMLVFTFDASLENQSSDVFLSYYRQKQLLDFTGDYPIIKGKPGLYEILKKDDNSLSVLIQNLFEDSVFDGVIELGESFGKMEIVGAEATLENNRIVFSSEIHPYDTVAVYLEK